MTSNADGASVRPQTRRQSRANLRQATFIFPKTGERVKRTVTFGNVQTLDGSGTDGPAAERTPLLGRRRSSRSPQLSSWNAAVESWNRLTKKIWTFANSRTGRGVFKCSVAYFLGSLATFVPFLTEILGQQDGKHIVATITVYFHPARSQGSMFEAILMAALAFVYAVFICFTSMGVSILFGQKFDLLIVGHIIVLIVFCGGGLGFVGWVKQRLGNPLVNVACSLTSLAIITVLTKEGAVQAALFSDDKIIQVMLMILMGVVMTTAVSFSISPVSARKDLRENMIQVTDSFADMLAAITRSFLTGSEDELLQDRFLNASAQYRTVFTSLTKNLKEAKFEHYFVGTENEYHLEAKLVNCIQRLAQNIGGLRSAATTQFLLLAQPSTGGAATPTSSVFSPQTDTSFSFMEDRLMSPSEHYGILTAISESPEDDQHPEDDEQLENTTNRRRDTLDDSNLPTINTPSDIFSRFIIHLGPSMKSLAVTLKQILDELPYGPAPDYSIAVHPHFKSSLAEAIELYAGAREKSLALLYKSKELNKRRPMEMEADFEEVAASCGHFSFSLQDLANELTAYLDILDELKIEIDDRPNGRTWKWLKFWPKNQRSTNSTPQADPERDSLIDQNVESDIASGISNPRARKASNLAKSQHSQSYTYRLWRAMGIFRRDDTKFAIKVGVGAALYALPSFLISTRPFYRRWRGEWGLLSYMLVCSMTIGASNTTGYARFGGTCIGAVCAIVSWIVSRGNAFALAAFGWLMSLWTSYIIVAQGKGPMGRFIMLTYNLSALYAYSCSVKDLDYKNDEGGVDPIITEIALHRVVAVLSGCLWGLIVTRLIWPISARQKFKDGLSLLWLRMALIWKRDPLATLLEGANTQPYMDLREEFELHRFLACLENLRSSAVSEIDFRGPFPDAAYGRILKSTARMLDAFHAMNVVITKDHKASAGETEILQYTTDERAQLCSRISHLFHVLASSMKLEFPLNEALPSTDHARDRLLAKIFGFRRSHQGQSGATDNDFALLYAYALVTGQLSKEIREAGGEIENLFGVLNEDLLKLQ